MRLNRYLSASGYTSRRKGEEIIRGGRISVNGVVVTDPAKSVDPGIDAVTVDDTPLLINPGKRYYIMSKPAGVIVSRGDTHDRATVFDLLGQETNGVFPVGRLDANTSGALLFTDDGDLAHRLTHPSFGVKKTYRAEVKGRVEKRDVRRLKEGLVLDDGPTAPADMVICESSGEVSLIEITLKEGRKRQVRRMLKFIGHPVRALERVSFGGINAGGVPPGGYRALEDGEVESLKEKISLISTEKNK